MDTFAEIADERRTLADLLDKLSVEQQATQSLCSDWTVHDVVAHLIMPLAVSTPKVAMTVLRYRGDFDRANRRLTGQLARRPFGELITVLRQRADKRFTPPGSGAEAPLTDVLVHGADIRWPLGIERAIPAERLRKALDHLSTGPRGVIMKGVLAGRRFQATELDWEHGRGAAVTGTSEALMLALTGRAAALDRLTGDGVPSLRSLVT